MAVLKISVIYILSKYNLTLVFLSSQSVIKVKNILFTVKIYSLMCVSVNLDLGTSSLSLFNGGGSTGISSKK